MGRIGSKILALGLTGMLLLGATACLADEGQTIHQTTTGNTLRQGKITASGSTSMEDLMLALGESFTVINPGVTVEIQGGGSSTGVNNASTKVTDIGNSSRALKDSEKSLGLNEHVIAIDGIAVAVNPQNPVTGLTQEQLAGIFTGIITNWQEVGGTDAPIVVVLREAGSGTRDGFEEILKIKDQCVSTNIVNETGIVKSTVTGNVNAIGYLSLGKVDNSVKALAIEGIAPTEATVKDKTYILQRSFLCLTLGEEPELVQAFLDYITSVDGQAMVVQKGYVSIR